MAVWAGLLACNDTLPYFGLRDDSCQTMFSGLDWGDDYNNHFFLPQRMRTDFWASWQTRAVRVEPWPTERRLRFVAEWLADDDREHGTEATRAAIDQLCRAGHSVALEARRAARPNDPHRGPEAPFERFDDACVVPVLAAPHRWIPVRLFDTDSQPFEVP